MPIRPELRPLYPPHWRELSSHVRFERAGGKCQRCGRPHLALLRCLPDGFLGPYPALIPALTSKRTAGLLGYA
jgi:hypothetical protein